MKYFTQNIDVSTSQGLEFLDVTDRVRQVVEKSQIKNGLVSVFSNHTTAGVKINEPCSRLQKDMESLLKEIAPPHKTYRHNEVAMDNRDNAHSHLMSLLTGVSETIPVTNGDLLLGTWQSIFFMEFDGPRSLRTITVTVIGE